MNALLLPREPAGEPPVFEKIVQDLTQQGFSVIPNALPDSLSRLLLDQVMKMPASYYAQAGIGRHKDYVQTGFVRRDEICWIEGGTEAEKAWLSWMQDLQVFINRKLFLGLFSYESHFSHYRPGDFFKKHFDAFRGQANRVLSTVAYLNPAWLPTDGGELVIYPEEGTEGTEGTEATLRVTPALGTLVVFLSEEFPHEVLQAQRHRYSIAGWFRVNTSINNQLDPPR